MKSHRDFGSFRDSSGFVFTRDGKIFRQINLGYQKDYNYLLSSGLYDCLVRNNLIVKHIEQPEVQSPEPDNLYKIIKPEFVKFISYPYEWCLMQIRGAGLTTLRIAKIALKHDMILKDASAFNVQFHRGQWVLIDTLSFTKYKEGEPWIAYKQFCQHFLAPMALMAYKDSRLGKMSRLFIDGIPLDMAAKLLPFRTKLRFGLLVHIYMHASSQARFANRDFRMQKSGKQMNREAMFKLFDSLRQTVKALPVKLEKSDWSDYYLETNYSKEDFTEKKAIVKDFIDRVRPKTLWDLGANTGEFSRIASSRGITTIAFDSDQAAVALNYLQVRKTKDSFHIPLVMDLTNPSPGLGWSHQERKSLDERGPADLILALALIHHLVISNNVPTEKLALFLKRICRNLVIEFIPKSDSQVKRLLVSRKDIFDDYHVSGFEEAFSKHFVFLSKRPVGNSGRMLYLMKVK